MPASFRQYKVKTDKYRSAFQPPLIDYSHPLARWLAHAYVLSVGFGVYDAVKGTFTRVTELSNMSTGATDSYQGVRRTGGPSTANGYIDVSSSAIPPPLTIVSQFRSIHNGDSARALLDDDNGSARKFQYRLDGTTTTNSYLDFIYFNTVGGAFAAATTAGSIKEGKIHVGVGRILSSGALDVFLDGTKGTPGTVTGTPATTNNTFRIFNRKTGASAYGGDIFLELVFNTGLTDDQVREISNNPWAVFIPSTAYAYNRFKEGEGQTVRKSGMLGTSFSLDVDSRYNSTKQFEHTQQPRVNYGIIFKNKSGSFISSSTLSDPHNTANVTLASDTSVVVTPYGIATKGTEGSLLGGSTTGKNVSITGSSDDFTIVTLVHGVSQGANSFSYLCGVFNGTYGTGISSKHTSFSGNWGVYDSVSSTSNSISSGETLPTSGLHLLVYVRRGTNRYLYRNGILKASDTTARVSNSVTEAWRQNTLASGSSAFGSQVPVLYSGLIFQALTQDQIVALANNPWSIFVGKHREPQIDNTPQPLWTPTIWTSKTRAIQPQQNIQVKNTQLSQGLISAFTGSSVFDHVRNGKKALYYNGTTGSLSGLASATSGGNYIQSFLDSSNYVNIPASSDFTFVYVGTAELQGTNPGFMRSGSFTFTSGAAGTGSTFNIVQGTNFRPWIRLNGTDILLPGSGDSFTAGQSYAVAFRVVSASSAAVAWNGKIRHTAAHSTSTPSFDVYGIGSQSSSVQYFGPLSGVLMYNRALTDAEMVEITTNPWQVFQPTKHRIYTGL